MPESLEGGFKTDSFNAANEAVREGMKRAVRAAAFAVQSKAIDNLTEDGTVDTGTLRRSVYVVCDGTDERAAKLAEALALAKSPGTKKKPNGKLQSPKGHPNAAPAVPGPPIDTAYQAKTAVAVDYGVYVEFGTVDMAAKPFLKPALEEVGKQFEKMAAAYVAEALKAALKGP